MRARSDRSVTQSSR